MKGKNIITGTVLILLGVGLFVFYDFYLKPNREAKELIVEGSLIYERGDKESINDAINVFTKVIAKYPESDRVNDAYFHIAQCYEKLGLQRLAYLKYVYLIKNKHENLSPECRKEILVRLAHINVLKQYSEEAISQLYGLLNTSFNNEFRSRVYSELGHTYLKQGDFQQAKRMFDIGLKEYGSNEDAILGQARALKRMGRDAEAYDQYEYFLKYYGAVSQYTTDVRNSYRDQAYDSGLYAFRRGQYNSAISFFDRVLRNFPDDRKSENALYWTGECYYAMSQFDNAIGFFNRVLSNEYYHKDQDARIKKGYSYFTSKRFDLAAKEFQIYLNHYSNGKYTNIARNWKEMSTKELLLRIKARKVPEVKKEEKVEKESKEEIEENEGDEEELDVEEPKKDEGGDEELEEESDEEISGDYYEDNIYGDRIKLENVAEL